MITTNYVGEAAIERIAKAYKEHPDELYLIPEEKIHLCRRLSNFIFSRLSDEIYFDFVSYEPYSYTTIKEALMDYDMGFIRVNSTGNNSKFWKEYYNLGFRSSHDYFHCYYKLNFNHKDEIKAFKKQMQFTKIIAEEYLIPETFLDSWIKTDNFDLSKKDLKLYEKVLRSEIIYQSAVKTYFKEFHLTEQKIILADL